MRYRYLIDKPNEKTSLTNLMSNSLTVVLVIRRYLSNDLFKLKLCNLQEIFFYAAF